ncbi:hypothetical protein AbraIFM66951_004707 [Aspergillus brasiliensis]|uniref:Uncharacterized protein n=1 Tax=Aspergillus brasiliensis TaxID=319629 RepID=A0A9W6DJB4_9EURO|nr:hypothetical protein AbraCBS73388_008330 [Aspergillus brasiliensis]GKZ43462.1 hypothetical protein AbraIFM66951_004707 [Aspergillus brasiliensis]
MENPLGEGSLLNKRNQPCQQDDSKQDSKTDPSSTELDSDQDASGAEKKSEQGSVGQDTHNSDNFDMEDGQSIQPNGGYERNVAPNSEHATDPGSEPNPPRKKRKTMAEEQTEWFRISPRTLQSNGFKVLKEKLEARKRNSSGSNVSQLENKSVLEMQNKELVHKIGLMEGYINHLEKDLVENNTLLVKIHSLTKPL